MLKFNCFIFMLSIAFHFPTAVHLWGCNRSFNLLDMLAEYNATPGWDVQRKQSLKAFFWSAYFYVPVLLIIWVISTYHLIMIVVDYGKFRDPATRAFTISWDTFIKDRYIYIMHRNIDEINCIVQFNHILVHGCSALFDIGEILLKSSSKLRFYPVSVEMKSFCVFWMECLSYILIGAVFYRIGYFVEQEFRRRILGARGGNVPD